MQRNITQMDDAVHRLLELKKTIILPEEIDHDAYHTIVEATLLYPDDEIDLYCRGQGGSSGDALAIVDAIKQHGNFTGLLMGPAVSSHAIIWAGCNTRYCYPNGRLGLHSVVTTYSPLMMDGRALLQSGKTSKAIDVLNAAILTDASRDRFEVWIGFIESANLSSYDLSYDDLIDVFKMALPIADRPKFATDGKGVEIKMLDGSAIPKEDYL